MIRALLTASLCFALAGCTLAGAVARGGGTGALEDANATIAIDSRMSRAQGFYLDDVDVEVTGGVALLSGEVPRPEDRIEAERIAWTGESVTEVANEITVGERAELGSSLRDEGIAQAVRAALLGDGQVRSVNYNVEVHNRVVYLLGVARTAAELERAAQTAARVGGVERVVTYVRVAGLDPQPDPAQ